MSKRELDLQGEVCPFPLFFTKDALEKMEPGETIYIKTDFNQSVRNILKWCEDQGHEFELDELDCGLWEITVTKK